MTHNVAVHVHDPDPPAPWSNTWTEERITLLIELRNTNMKRGRIALEINSRTGSNFTRAAVCGKIDRIFPAAKPRLTEEEKAASYRASMERWNAKRREAARQKRIALGLGPDSGFIPASMVQPLAVVVFRPEDFTDANVRGVANLEKHHCRWIFGDDMAEPVFCGLPQLEGRSFCAGHSAIVYAPPQKRRTA